ncbi:hypothetical protein J7T55_011983 [Diaporthe amygdali]|uniref:uncharacterized protein n=1 Tax=Phomopsis amygdali TaxID=1214568 RepID=UPI0022FDDA14|nr:uncharacterized protein J7T55_011983 [Diaporthe amygdali]KAJ0123518.1 hypothetical protein J7T55_011983 [Diaporthe amygdali]
MRFPSIKSVKSTRSASSVSSDASTLPPDRPVISGGLTVLHPTGDDGKALVDIITVHGLSGHPQNTWTNFDTQHYWPRESLPVDVPMARIMAFGYSTTVSPFNKSTAIVSDVAKQLISHLINKRRSRDQKQRPIVFVAHSLGGIVVKEFLHVASNTGHEDLASCVCGILFLGTPHKGSHLASFMGVISDVVKSLIGGSADAIIEDLSSNSRHLLELDQLLRFKLARIDIYSFYELLPLKPLSRPVVERHSALLNIPSELEQIGLEADHRQMCRPPDRNHFIYETIAQRILSIMNRQIHKAQYASDLVEMVNNFASKHMDHIAVLTKQMHECQVGSELTPMIVALQHTVSLHVSHSKGPEEVPTSGFEEVLKSLPVHEVKSFVDGIQRLMERAKSLQDLILMTERENARKRAEARMEAERQASEQRIRELLAENARLKGMATEKEQVSLAAARSQMQLPGAEFGRMMSSSRKTTQRLASGRDKSPLDFSGFGAGELLGTPDPVMDASKITSELWEPMKRTVKARKSHTIDRTREAAPPVISRAKRQMPEIQGSKRKRSSEEESDPGNRRYLDRVGCPDPLNEAADDGLDFQEACSPPLRSQCAVEAFPFGSHPRAGPSMVGAAREHPGHTGHASTELEAGHDTPPHSSGTIRSYTDLGIVSVEALGAHTELSFGDNGPQAGIDLAGNVEQESEPKQGVQQPAASTMTAQEAKLIQNREHMQGVVEKLSLMLQVGQHVMGTHDDDAVLTAEP